MIERIVVLDTNVLLADPGVLLSFPDAEVVIPETVLGELDKLKTSRVDPDLRFRGREVSRVLFDLSEQGSLVEGVELPDGGSLRVAPLDTEGPMPEGLQSRNADDRILATAMQVCKTAGSECKVVLVTNDLNMLLKAQTLGVPVQRHGDGVEGSFSRRFIIRPFQRYKIPLAILAMSVAIFAAIIVVVTLGSNRSTTVASLPPEFVALLSGPQQKALDYLTALQNDPRDQQALLGMAQYYYGIAEQARGADPATSIGPAQQAVRYYVRYLELKPDDRNARTDLASAYFYSGDTDSAITQAGEVLGKDPDHVNANFNLALIYMQGRGDLESATTLFEKVQRLTKDDPNQHAASAGAEAYLKAIRARQGAESEIPTGGTQ